VLFSFRVDYFEPALQPNSLWFVFIAYFLGGVSIGAFNEIFSFLFFSSAKSQFKIRSEKKKLNQFHCFDFLLCTGSFEANILNVLIPLGHNTTLWYSELTLTHPIPNIHIAICTLPIWFYFCFDALAWPLSLSLTHTHTQ
jgi:hypothetical protein